MLGAIIGDLVASTYMQNKEEFYARLVGEKATCSELTVAVAWIVKTVSESRGLSDALLLKSYQAYLMSATHWSGVVLSDNIREWIKLPNMWKNESGVGMFLMRQGTLSYWFEWDSGKRDRIDYGMDKEEFYASMFLSKMLTKLRLGWTKEEVWHDLGSVFKGCYEDWNWRTETVKSLNYLFRAWDCFYNSYDFGIALHNAVKMVGDTRTNCALTGMIAAAMYGCELYFIKNK